MLREDVLVVKDVATWQLNPLALLLSPHDQIFNVD